MSDSCDSMDCCPPGSSVHGILQARILDWVAISFSKGIFLTQGLNPGLLQADSLATEIREKPKECLEEYNIPDSEHRGRAVNQGIGAASRSWNSKEKDSFLEPPEWNR